MFNLLKSLKNSVIFFVNNKKNEMKESYITYRFDVENLSSKSWDNDLMRG